MKESLRNLVYLNFFKLFTALVILLGFFYIIGPFIIPVIFGGILALAASPYVQKMMARGFSRTKSLLFLTLFLLLVIFLPMMLFFFRGFKVVSQFFSEQAFSTLTTKGQERVLVAIDKLTKQFGVDPNIINEKIVNLVNDAGTFLIRIFGSLVSQIPNIVILSVITLFAFYFFLLKEDHIRNFYDRFFHFKAKNGDEFILVLKSSSREVFVANVITGLIQSSIVAGGALICNVGDFYIILFVTFIVSFIPVIGAAPVAFFLSIYSFIDDHVGDGITMAVIGIISGSIDNIVRPYLSSSFGKVKVPLFVSFIAVIGGVFVLGIPGLFVGPLLASLLFGAIPIIAREFFPQIENEEVEKNAQS